MTVGELVDLFPLEQRVNIDGKVECKAIAYGCTSRSGLHVNSCNIGTNGLLCITTNEGLHEIYGEENE